MAPLQSKSEHWLTLMCCADCKQTPDESPVYMCSLGHTLCLNCFKALTRLGIPKCAVCNTTKFTAKTVSADFLKKLKTRPGIGRPYRYGRVDPNPPIPKHSALEMRNQDDSITVEKLFQMPTEELRKLFEETSKRRTKLTAMHSSSTISPLLSKNSSKSVTRPWSIPPPPHFAPLKTGSFASTSADLHGTQSIASLQSRKPLTCPHDPCGKIIAMSSFQLHFKHEHANIAKITVFRGDMLQVNLNSTHFEFSKTICLAMVTINDKSDFSASTHPRGYNANIAKRFPEKVVIGTYWLMMSGSHHTQRTHAYMLFWLFTNETKDQCTNVNCTLEVASQGDEMAFSAFCSVNVVPDDLSASAVARRLHCLYVTYGGIESLLTYGSKPIFRMTIH